MFHLDFLGDKIRNVWDALGRTGDQYVLIGGTALAYRLGHRAGFFMRPARVRRPWY